MTEAEYHVHIKEMPKDERPRERLEVYGAQALSNAELLAIALRTGTKKQNVIGLSQNLLTQFEGLGGLSRASVQEMCVVPGIGKAKAIQIKAAMELGKRVMFIPDGDRIQITCPQDAANLLMSGMSMEIQEQLRVILLDTKHRVLRQHTLYQGNVNSSIVRVAEVFREAIKDNAVAIIVAHNHPSGDPTPSAEDVRVTEELVRAGKMLDIEVLDHVIIGRQRHLSMKERGIGFS